MKEEKTGCKIQSSRPKSRNSANNSDLRDFLEKTGTEPGHTEVVPFSLHADLYDILQDVCKEKKIMYIVPRPHVDFKPPKLHDTGDCWYVYFSVKNPETGKFKRFRIKVNRGTVREKKAAAREIMASLSQKLQLGWSPMVGGQGSRGAVPAFEVFQAFENVKAKEMEAQSLASYRSYIRTFRKFLESVGFSDRSLIVSIDREVARDFMEHLEADDKISPATYNNYLSFMVTFFGWIRRRGYIQENVFEGFDRKPKRLTRKKRRLLDDSELIVIFRYLAEENPEYLAICLLCYCCFMRPKEIALLRCGDIDLKRQTVHVSEEIAKNDNESFRTIPTVAMPVFRLLNLARPSYYLFGGKKGDGGDFTPGPEPCGQKKIGHFWENHIKDLKGVGEGVSFYSLKDTGITRTLSEGVALNFVQQQADHSSPAVTGIYVGKTAEALEVMKRVDILPEHPLVKK